MVLDMGITIHITEITITIIIITTTIIIIIEILATQIMPEGQVVQTTNQQAQQELRNHKIHQATETQTTVETHGIMAEILIEVVQVEAVAREVLLAVGQAVADHQEVTVTVGRQEVLAVQEGDKLEIRHVEIRN